jgi:hypothetical protein
MWVSSCEAVSRTFELRPRKGMMRKTKKAPNPMKNHLYTPNEAKTVLTANQNSGATTIIPNNIRGYDSIRKILITQKAYLQTFNNQSHKTSAMQKYDFFCKSVNCDL